MYNQLHSLNLITWELVNISLFGDICISMSLETGGENDTVYHNY